MSTQIQPPTPNHKPFKIVGTNIGMVAVRQLGPYVTISCHTCTELIEGMSFAVINQQPTCRRCTALRN